MTAERLAELQKQSALLIRLNDLYHKYLYISTFLSIENEKQRILKAFK